MLCGRALVIVRRAAAGAAAALITGEKATATATTTTSESHLRRSVKPMLHRTDARDERCPTTAPPRPEQKITFIAKPSQRIGDTFLSSPDSFVSFSLPGLWRRTHRRRHLRGSFSPFSRFYSPLCLLSLVLVTFWARLFYDDLFLSENFVSFFRCRF